MELPWAVEWTGDILKFISDLFLHKTADEKKLLLLNADRCPFQIAFQNPTAFCEGFLLPQKQNIVKLIQLISPCF